MAKLEIFPISMHLADQLSLLVFLIWLEINIHTCIYVLKESLLGVA